MQNNILTSKKNMKTILVTVNIFCLILIFKIGYIQLIQGNELKQKSLEQQNSSRKITASRGTIYDATEKNILAQSSTVETVTINPVNISKDNKEKVSKILSEIFEVDYEKVFKKVNKNSSIETIVKRVDKEKTNKLRSWLKENNIYNGINIDEDTKRYYPYATLASHVIGFVRK